MTKWTRARVATVCGGCSRVIFVGDPMLLFELEKVQHGRRVKVRCVQCDGPAPPDLPALVLEREPPAPFTLTRFTRDMLPLDFKQRQLAQEREPGEEG